MRTLYSIAFSPWSELARWALDHHRVDYRKVEYLPLVAEVQLRAATGHVFARISAPTLVDGKRVLADSLDIARHAELLGQGASLFPGGPNGDVVAWNDRAQRALSAGRTLFFGRISDDRDALREQVPSFVPEALRDLSVPIVERTFGYLSSKYRANADSPAQAQAALVEEFEHLEACLARGPYLLGSFSYADILMATALHFVAPVGDRHRSMGHATRESLRDAALAERFGKIAAWRDDLYDRHRS
jgi:glutathione S-transferase